jgi:hypothetical protein
MPQPFGKRNRPAVATPGQPKPRRNIISAPSPGKARLYLLIAGSILILVLAGYALAL